jgi:hypothetical protein
MNTFSCLSILVRAQKRRSQVHYVCEAPGCREKAASPYGAYCHSHRSRRRRHGAINQEAITKADLKIYRQLVKERIEKNKGKELWEQLRAVWGAVIREAQATLDEWSRGKPMPSFKRIAAVELVKLSNAVEPQEVIETVLSMYLLQDQEPRKIKGDTAFLTQMVRRVRGLTSLNAGAWTDSSTGRKKVAYKELSPKAVEAMGKRLASAFGLAGVTLAGLERKDHERRQQELAAYHQALGDLQ